MDYNEVKQTVLKIADVIEENRDYLSSLDAAIGDGDHGFNLSKGFGSAKRNIEKQNPAAISDLLKVVATALIATVGGASGPLYGTVFLKASTYLKGKDSIDLKDFTESLKVAIEGVMQRGKAVKGEKTMLDSLIPALDSLKASVEAGEPAKIALEKAVGEAKAGVEYTKTIIATKGRASYLGERSLGHADPGATSSAMILETIYNCANK
jgi:dihydroxyacetone kinase-like protein